MNKLVAICALLFAQVSLALAQSENAMQQSQQKEMMYYKNKMIPQGEQYVDDAPIRFTKSIVIDAPANRVWETLDDTPGFASWFPGVKWGKMVVASEKGMGAKRLAQLNNIKYYEEIIAYEKDKAWGITMIESSTGLIRSITEVMYLEAIDANTTKVIFKGGYEYRGMGKLLKGMMGKTTMKIWTSALEGLKKYVEGDKYMKESPGRSQ